ncbi:MAG TPA: C2 family cysteine protease [Methylophilus sp.]
MEVNVGVINPYAVAELIAQKKINWEQVAAPQNMLAEILGLSEEKIFDLRNPVLRPDAELTANGSLKVLPEAQAASRLSSFLKAQTVATPSSVAAQRLRLATLQKNTAISETLLQTAVRTSTGNGTPWTPADKDWIDMGDYFEDVAELNDPVQGALGDCYFIAAMSSVAWARPYAIVNMIRPSAWGNEEQPIHKVNFFKSGTGTAQAVEVTELVPVSKPAHNWVYARSLDAGETWPAVMEKAYAKWRTSNTTDFPNYPTIAGGDPVMACAEIISGQRSYVGHAGKSGDDLWTFVRSHSMSKRTINPMVAWTYDTPPSGTNYTTAKVVANHAYSILGWEFINNEKYIVLRNPWGTHHAVLDTLSGNWSAHQVSFWANIPLNSNGVFAMKASTFQKYFSGSGVTV